MSINQFYLLPSESAESAMAQMSCEELAPSMQGGQAPYTIERIDLGDEDASKVRYAVQDWQGLSIGIFDQYADASAFIRDHWLNL